MAPIQNIVGNINSGLLKDGDIRKGILLRPLDISLSDFIPTIPGYAADKTITSGAEDVLSSIKIDYSLRENLEEWLFKHYLEDIDVSYPRGYLSSYKTPDDNEDPISFGYDVIINYDTSPFFNGSIENFCDADFVAGITEIQTRKNLIEEFKKQFFKFFKVDTPSTVGAEKYSVNNRTPQKVRTYYIRKIVGLDKLSETINSDSPLQFTNYGKDYLSLTLYEDVTLNMGYLATLYRMLSWSRLHGKNMFPENLLRFDMNIVVTEARRFDRSDENGNQYADVISRYVYQLYECQMFFERLTHEDTIDMTKLDLSEGFDIKINYKYATLKFEWLKNYDFSNKQISELNNSIILNNRYSNLNTTPSDETNNAVISDNNITATSRTYDFNQIPASLGSNPSIYGYYHSDSGLRDGTSTLRDKLLEKTIQNIKDNTNRNIGVIVSGFIDSGWSYNIKEYQKIHSSTRPSLLLDIINTFATAINSGFTDGGWTINLAAWYLNRTFNRLNNTILNALGLNSSLNTTKPGSYINSFSSDGFLINSEDYKSMRGQFINSRIVPTLINGPRGWRINSI